MARIDYLHRRPLCGEWHHTSRILWLDCWRNRRNGVVCFRGTNPPDHVAPPAPRLENTRHTLPSKKGGRTGKKGGRTNHFLPTMVGWRTYEEGTVPTIPTRRTSVSWILHESEPRQGWVLDCITPALTRSFQIFWALKTYPLRFHGPSPNRTPTLASSLLVIKT